MGLIIVGAGVVGASTAFHLAMSGERVTVIDAQLDGRATAAGAGIICPWVSGVEDAAFYRLYTAGGDYYPDLIAALAEAGETKTGYRRTGAMLVSGDVSELSRIERMACRRAVPAMGEVRRLSDQQAQALFPPLRPGFGGIFISGGARVDGRNLAAALLRAAERLGATVLHGHAALVAEAGRVRGVDVGGQRFGADRVIVTAAGQAEVLAEALGVAPGLGAATLMETRVGFRPAPAALQPALGWVRGVEGLAVGTGLGAAGLTIGPFAGRLLADLMAGGPALLDLAPFDPSRRAPAMPVPVFR
jgi:D-amino-acid dehydrogenase